MPYYKRYRGTYGSRRRYNRYSRYGRATYGRRVAYGGYKRTYGAKRRYAKKRYGKKYYKRRSSRSAYVERRKAFRRAMQEPIIQKEKYYGKQTGVENILGAGEFAGKVIGIFNPPLGAAVYSISAAGKRLYKGSGTFSDAATLYSEIPHILTY